jgi:micrococcal nuclease
VTVEVRYCPQCGTRRTGYFRFCGRCGFDFDELRIGNPSEDLEPKSPRKPEPTTPIWPPPVQWPPPDATPPTPEPEPQAAIWPVQSAPTTSVRITQTATERPLLAESLTPPQPRPAIPVAEPVHAGPTVSRRSVVTWTRIAIVALAALLALNAISRAMTSSSGSAPTSQPTVVLGSPVIVASPTALSTPSPVADLTPGPSFEPTGQTQFAVVTKVVDGDTIRVDIDGTEFPVRYIGIDAPEPDTTDPAVKRLADAATATNARLVEGQDVYLERDVSDKDQFDRLLRNVWMIDSGGSQVLVNLELVRLGFAAVTTFPPDEKYVDLLTSAQAAAQSEALGLWAGASTTAASPSPAAIATPKTLVGAGGDSTCHESYTPCLPIVGDLDCPDVRGLGKAPVTVRGPDDYRLDSDGDGLGCE